MEKLNNEVLLEKGCQLDALLQLRPNPVGIQIISYDELINISKSNLSLHELAKKYQISEETLKRIIRKAGLKKKRAIPFHKRYYITKSGDFRIYMPEHPSSDKRGYVHKSRLIMEEFLGRFLKKEEVVHHINRNRLDNRIENLRLFPNHNSHLKFHSENDMERLSNGTLKWKIKIS